MKEHPIIFNSEMVRAILDGRKTMTRRVIKDICNGYVYCENHEFKERQPECFGWKSLDGKMMQYAFCPYGKVGDTLWVRETFAVYDGKDNFSCYQGGYDSETAKRLGYPPHVVRKSDGAKMSVDFKADYPKANLKWRPSIHMPRTASRITLEITNIRVERLQEISEADIKAEGITDGKSIWAGSYRAAFMTLWDKINGKREGCAWKDNPFVWVIEFKKT